MKNILAFVLLSSMVWATTVTFKGEEVTLNSKGIKVGHDAPEFTAVTKNFTEFTVGGKKEKVQVIAFIPSFDTDTCKLETIAFNKKISEQNALGGVIGLDKYGNIAISFNTSGMFRGYRINGEDPVVRIYD